MNNFAMFGVVIAILAGCSNSSGSSNNNPRPGPVTNRQAAPLSTGPINSACLSSNRSARSRTLCGCIQTVANQTLSGSQQNRAAAFYNNPHQAQVIRQSDRAADERFWKAYRAYGERSEQVCS
ncbi:hypothetical protein AAFO92_18315 [Roseovarius sp. CAU 1744]|uniref:hypothetical protein n=1 Tax=Roseovarius sp. CAU 1744 TaxID=3140368 RepID=UPI00325B37DB